MAGKIKGLTIQLDADVSGVQQAFSTLTKNANATDRLLKELNQSLKFDPGNQDLLAQKFQSLGKALTLSDDKISALKNELKTLEGLDGGTGKFETNITKVQTALVKAQRSAEMYKKEISQLDCLDASVKAELVGSLPKEVQSAIADISKLDGQHANVKASLEGSLSSEINKAKGDVTELDGKSINIKADSSGLSDLKGNLGDLAESAKGGFSGLEGLIAGSIGQIGSLGPGAIAAASAVAGVGYALKAISDNDNAIATIQTQLGITRDEAEKLQETAEELWKHNFSENVEEATQKVIEIRKLWSNFDSSNINEMAEAFSTVATVGGAEFNDVLKTGTVLMRNFEIDTYTAADAMTYLFQNGGDYSGELLDTLREYAPQFNAMGMSAEEFTKILIQGANNGAFNLDKVGDAIKEMNIRMKDGSKGTSEALSSLGLNADEMTKNFAQGGDSAKSAFVAVTAALSKVKDPLKQNQLGVQLMGTQYEDLEKNVIQNMTNISGSVEGLGGSTKRASDAMGNTFSAKITVGLRSAQDAINDFFQSLDKLPQTMCSLNFGDISGNVKKTLDTLKNIDVAGVSAEFVNNIINTLKTTIANTDFGSIGAQVGSALGKVVNMAIEMIGQLGEMIGQIDWGTLGQTLGQFLIQWVTAAIADLFTFITTVDWGALIMNVLALVGNVLIGLVTLLGGMLWGLVDGAFKELFGKDWLSQFTKIGEMITGGFKIAIEALTGFGGWIWSKISEFGNFIGSNMQSVISSTINVANWFRDRLNDLTNFGNWIWANISGFATQVCNNISGKASEIGTSISKMFDDAIKSLGDVAKRFVQLGVDVVSGIAQGIWYSIGKVKDAIGGVANSIGDKFKGVLGIHSPSRVMADHAFWVGAGVAKGIEKSTSEVENAVTDMVSSAEGAFNPNLSVGISKSDVDMSNALKGVTTQNSSFNKLAEALNNFNLTSLDYEAIRPSSQKNKQGVSFGDINLTINANNDVDSKTLTELFKEQAKELMDEINDMLGGLVYV